MRTSSEDVLLIEGDVQLAKRYGEALESDEIRCGVALEADAAELAAAWQPALILLDTGSSYRLDGLAVLEELHRNKFTADIPVIILSGNTDRYVIERLRAHGAADYWALQELSPEALVRRVKRWFAASPNAGSHPGVVRPPHPKRN